MSDNAEQIDHGPAEAADPRSPASGSGEAATDGAAGNGASGLTKDRVLEALKEVLDPELGINIVDLGLVYEVGIEGDTVHITYTLTTMGCPIGPLIEAQMQELLSGVEGVDKVEAEMVLRPAWTPE